MTQGLAGIDPLSDLLTLEAFASLVARHPDLPAHGFLVDHDVFTRITPPLADQVLARAQIAADRPVSSLSDPEIHRFHRSLRDVFGQTLEGHHGYPS
jgi:formamidopyrimidine-DNA glycosylase